MEDNEATPRYGATMSRLGSLTFVLLAATLINCGGLIYDPGVGSVGDGGGRDGHDGGSAADGSRDAAPGDTGPHDAGAPSPRDAAPAVCGDSVVAVGEQCDDGNLTTGDGCNANCQIERGWSCSGAPMVCDTVCGDGIVAGSETCDNEGACLGTCRRSAWSKSYGDQWYKLATGLAVDTTGAPVVTGTFAQTIDFGRGTLTSAGSNDIYVAKIDSNGNTVWSRRFGGTGDDRSTAIATDSAGNIVVTGMMSGTVDFGGGPLVTSGVWDVFVLQLDANGNHLWSKRFGDERQQEANAVAFDATGNILIGGMAAGALDFGGGPLTSPGFAGFVAKLDSAGNHVWSKHVATSPESRASGIASGPAGEVFVVGTCKGTTDLGEGPAPGIGDSDGFLIALDASGQHQWSKKWGALNGYQSGAGVTVDAAGDVVVTGGASGPTDLGTGVLLDNGLLDVIVGKFSPAGSPIFARRFGSPRNEYPAGVATDASNNIFVTGYHSGPVPFGTGAIPFAGGTENAFVLQLSPSGTPLWSRGFASSSRARGLGIGVDSLGSVFLTGELVQGVTIGATRHSGDGVFVAKLTP